MKAVGYKNRFPSTTADALIDFETAKPEPKGRDIRVAVKAISANPVDYKVRKRAAPPEGETKILGYDAAGIVDAVGPDVTLFKPGDEVFYAGSIQRQGTNSEFHLVDERIVGHKPKTLSFAQAAALSADLDHRVGIAVRPSRRGARQKRRSAHAADHRRRRRRRLDPDPAGAAPHRPDGGGDGVPAGIAKMVPRSRRACRHRSCQADEGADRKLKLPPVALIASLTNTDQHYKALADIIAPQGKFGLIDDPPEFNVSVFKGKAVSIHWESMFTRSSFQTPDMIGQHHLLNDVADLIDKGVLRTTLDQTFGTINAANLKRAHALLESGKSRGKIVLEGW